MVLRPPLPHYAAIIRRSQWAGHGFTSGHGGFLLDLGSGVVD